MAKPIGRADLENRPALLPPKRPLSLPNLVKSGPSWHVTANQPDEARLLPPLPPHRRPSTKSQARSPVPAKDVKPSIKLPMAQQNSSRPASLRSISSVDTISVPETSVRRSASNGSERQSRRRVRPSFESPNRTPKLEPIRDDEPLRTRSTAPPTRFPPTTVQRQSSLRFVSRPSDDEIDPPLLPSAMFGPSYSDPQLRSDRRRPVTHPASQPENRMDIPPMELSSLTFGDDDPWQLPPLSRSSSRSAMVPKPKASFRRLSSLDNMIQYREDKAEWKRASRSSSMVHHARPEPAFDGEYDERAKTFAILDELTFVGGDDDATTEDDAVGEPEDPSGEDPVKPAPSAKPSTFRHVAMEVGFCFTIAMTQFLAEYLISGFAIALPKLLATDATVGGQGAMGIFWPATLLSLILSATLFIFARLSDMYSGYFIFMFGVAWLVIWTLIPGLCRSLIWLDVSRAMQGLAIAAFMPSTFTMVGSIYPEGPRRNFVMGLYSGCAPLGFFAGFLCAGALPPDKPQWYFWIASVLAATTFVTAFLSVPSDRTDRKKLRLKMDWIGSFLIMAGLILVSYALAVEPYANQVRTTQSGFAFPIVFGPFSSGVVCLAVAFWYEGWVASCPLLPFDFFKPKSVKSFSFACLCFYASFGVWLYNSAQFFESPTGTTTHKDGMDGITLALWYTPTAIGGVVLCIVGGSLMHIVPIMVLLLISALAWIAAPLLLALAPLPLNYWSYVVPSMLCATIGVDLTFTISIVFFSSVQPLRYQGLSGAVASSLINLAMSFALSISGIVTEQAKSSVVESMNKSINWGFQASFIYGAASAGLGLILCVLCVRISRSVVRAQPMDDEETSRTTSSDSTLVDDEEEQERQVAG